MSRKEKKPESKPSKAYLVSFGDTMTALLAFFIVLNSLAKDQTGANLYTVTGSFVNAIKSIGVSGEYKGDRSNLAFEKEAPAPLYLVRSEDEESENNKGPDDRDDAQRIINRQVEQFKRFLGEMARQSEVVESPPVKSRIVLDSWERFEEDRKNILGSNSIQLVTEAIAQLTNKNVEIELVFWADMPGERSLIKSIGNAAAAEQQVDRLFRLTPEQRGRIQFSTKPWLFVDSKRPIMSVVIAKLSAAHR